MNPDTLLQSVKAFFSQPEMEYAGLVFVLFVLPRIFIRFGIPLAISAFCLGLAAALFDWRVGDSDIVKVLSVLGIISLFLFAGLEVNLSEIKSSYGILGQHLVVRAGLVLAATGAAILLFGLDIRAGGLLALAILTPSTGFILDSLDSLQVSESGKYWIRTKAIAAEIFALIFMFVFVKSATLGDFLLAFCGLAALLLGLPVVFRLFMGLVLPVAPHSEFGFLVILALLAGLVTKSLGAYYLIGAFVVGLVAGRFEKTMPRLTGRTMMKSLRSFAGFFIPFYFFHAGNSLNGSAFSWWSISIGFLLVLVVVPMRVYAIIWHRQRSLDEPRHESVAVAIALLPNLVFGLVLADLLKNTFSIDESLIGVLVTYTITVSLLPALILRFVANSEEQRRLAQIEAHLGDSFWPYPTERSADKNGS